VNRVVGVGVVGRVGIFVAAAAMAVALALAVAVAWAGSVAAAGSEVAVITTLVHDGSHANITGTSVPVGTQTHPYVSVSGIAGTPTGGVYTWVWDDATCTGDPVISYATNPLVNGVLHTGTNTSSFNALTRSFRSHYSGDATYAAGWGGCVTVTFTKINPTVYLALHKPDHSETTSIKVGTSLHAFVDPSGSLDEPTGTVKVARYATGNCTGSPAHNDTFTLVDGQIDTPTLFQPLTADDPSWSFRAWYSGDSTYTSRWSDCSALSVTKLTPTLTVDLHDENHDPGDDVLLDEKVHAHATLSGALGTPTGTVTIRVYDGAACTNPLDGVDFPAAADMDRPANYLINSAPNQDSWQVEYHGDSVYFDVVSECLTSTWRAPTTLTLAMHDAAHTSVTTIELGESVHPRAEATSSFGVVSGNVKVRWFPNGSCSTGKSLGSLTLNASGVAHGTALAFKPSKTGTYSFRATYAATLTYAAATSNCVVVKVTAAQPSASPSPGTTPEPSAAPSTAPSVGPSAPPATAEPSIAAPTSGPSAPGPSAAPTGAADSQQPAATGADSPSPAPGGPASGGGDESPLLLLGIMILIVILVFALIVGTRRRKRDPTAA
jgi:hypothetical protein